VIGTARGKAAHKQMGAWRGGARIATYRPGRYVPGGLAWAAFHSLPLVTGLILKAVFDRISGGRPATGSALSLLAVLVAAEAGRAAVGWLAMTSWPSWWQAIAAWVRANTLQSVLVAPGPPSRRLPGSPGEAVARFRDDVEDLIWFVDVWVDVTGGLVFTAVALAIMLAISPLVTLMVVLPLLGVIAGTRGLSHVIRRYHQQMRESGSSVTDFVADLFAGALTLKTAGAEESALARFRERNATRAQAAIRARVARDLIPSISGMSVEISIGLVLLLSAGAMRDRRFTVGDLALFTSYAEALTWLPMWLGRMIARQREAGIALQRLPRLHPERRTDEVLTRRPVYLTGTPPPAPVAGSRPGEITPLRRLEVAGLTATHPGSGRGVSGVGLSVEAGCVTVVTGAVGSGKSTLVRALLGLIPVDSGKITWNDTPVDDPGAVLVPPRVAYVAQAPRLFSATLDENLRLGWPVSDAVLDDALSLAQLDGEVADMPTGLGTIIGPRGSRLSAGQSQRTAIARALVRRPQLLVLDDISSALDIGTEAELWRALAGTGITCLAASHRRAAIERADHIVVLDRGRVAAAGTFGELLASSPEFRHLWQAEVFGEADAITGWPSGHGGENRPAGGVER
jgi:ATP-binding cassette subfamily B protein